MRWNSSFALAVFCLFVFSSDEATAGGPLDDLAKGFEHACLANVGKSPEFSSSEVKAGLKKSKATTSLQAWWKPGKSCRVEYFHIENVAFGADVSAKVQNLAVKFAARIGGTVKVKRKGKRNESYQIKAQPRSYSISVYSSRSRKLGGFTIIGK